MDEKHEPVMGFWRAWGLVVGLMIGSGVFMLPTVLAPYGWIGVGSWLITGTGTLALAFSLAALAKRIPKVGGPYAYTRAGFGDFAGFLMAWGYWVSVWVASAAIAVAFVGYLGVFIPAVTASPGASIAAGVGIIWVLTYLNFHSIHHSSVFQLVTSIAKVLPLVLLGTLGFVGARGEVYDTMVMPSGSPLAALATAGALAMWAFVGFEVGTIPAGDIKEPKKTIPRALIAGVGLVVVLYLAVTVVVFGLVPSEQLMKSTSPLADAASVLLGPWGAGFVALVALVATASALNCNILAVGQMPMAAAMDGLFPQAFGQLTKRGTPGVAFLVGAVLSSAALMMNYVKGLVGAFEFLILLSTLTTVVPLSFSAGAAWLFAAGDKSLSRRERLRDGITAVLGFLYSLWAIGGAGTEAVYWGFLLLMVGVPVYADMRAKANALEDAVDAGEAAEEAAAE
ncbi:APC family permease [Kordiimonas marina]|uniref:APC family permease n=1 Tax=Kordiimonas marina TaxID=2872312 RepID=UPI001FF1A527|nr:amino acid permease [Kordiimonas marina]MCJ9429447.1 amino acid permease [Kordiimonas marina]